MDRFTGSHGSNQTLLKNLVKDGIIKDGTAKTILSLDVLLQSRLL